MVTTMKWFAVLSACMLLGACGGNSASSPPTKGTPAAGAPDEDQIRTVHGKLTTALADRDGSEACSLLTVSARAQLVTAASFGGDDVGDCAEAVNIIASAVPDEDARDASLTKITVTGDRAVAQTNERGKSVHLIRTGGRWLVDADPEGQ